MVPFPETLGNDNPDVEQMASFQDGARLAGVMPYLEAELESMERVVENRVYSALDAKTLTPEAALLAWIEKSSIRRLRTRMKVRTNVTIASGGG